CVAFSPDGKTVLTGSGDNTARLWDGATARPLHGPFPHPDGVTSVAFSPDGGAFVTGCRDRVARLWDVKTQRQRGPGLVHPQVVRAVAFHPRDPRIVLTGSEDRTAPLSDAPPRQH